jgi:DNA gyrase/topoisomerase IV subunit A
MLQGMGKRVPLDKFRIQRRGGMGLKSIRLNEGDTLTAVEVVSPHGRQGTTLVPTMHVSLLQEAHRPQLCGPPQVAATDKSRTGSL